MPDAQYVFGRQCTSVLENQCQPPSVGLEVVTFMCASAAFLSVTGASK